MAAPGGREGCREDQGSGAGRASKRQRVYRMAAASCDPTPKTPLLPASTTAVLRSQAELRMRPAGLWAAYSSGRGSDPASRGSLRGGPAAELVPGCCWVSSSPSLLAAMHKRRRRTKLRAASVWRAHAGRAWATFKPPAREGRARSHPLILALHKRVDSCFGPERPRAGGIGRLCDRMGSPTVKGADDALDM